MGRESNSNVNLFPMLSKSKQEEMNNLDNNGKKIFSEDQLEMHRSKAGKIGQWSHKTSKTALQLRCARVRK